MAGSGYGPHHLYTRCFPNTDDRAKRVGSESWAIDHKAPEILTQLSPQTLTADDAYTQASRIRRWAKSQVALITPALRWTKGRYAKAYHRFISQPKQRRHLSKRRSSVEPLFDLIQSYWNFDSTEAVTGQGVFQRPLLFSYSGLISASCYDC